MSQITPLVTTEHEKKKKKEDVLEFSSNLSIDLSHDLINFKNTKYKKKAQNSQTSAESEISVKSH